MCELHESSWVPRTHELRGRARPKLAKKADHCQSLQGLPSINKRVLQAQARGNRFSIGNMIHHENCNERSLDCVQAPIGVWN